MTKRPQTHEEWQEEYRRRVAQNPVFACMDASDSEGTKNRYGDLLDRHVLRRAIAGRRVRRALDLGCGVCRLSSVLAEGAETVIALDASSELLQVGRRNGVSENVRLVRGDLRNLAVGTGSIDLVFMAGVLLHMVEGEALRAAAEETARVLRPGGRALLLENLSPTDESIFREGIAHRSVRDVTAAFTAAGMRLRSARAVRKMPSRFIHWAIRGYLPRALWGVAIRMEPLLAGIGREPPVYREHLIDMVRNQAERTET